MDVEFRGFARAGHYAIVPDIEATAGATLKPMVIIAQAMAAKADAMWVLAVVVMIMVLSKMRIRQDSQ
jgi:hypothetical protein